VKAQLGSSAKNEEVGRIVLDQLCPAVHAILLDGLKTHVRSFFGKVKNSAWKVVEDSIDTGKVKLMCILLQLRFNIVLLLVLQLLLLHCVSEKNKTLNSCP